MHAGWARSCMLVHVYSYPCYPFNPAFVAEMTFMHGYSRAQDVAEDASLLGKSKELGAHAGICIILSCLIFGMHLVSWFENIANIHVAL